MILSFITVLTPTLIISSCGSDPAIWIWWYFAGITGNPHEWVRTSFLKQAIVIQLSQPLKCRLQSLWKFLWMYFILELCHQCLSVALWCCSDSWEMFLLKYFQNKAGYPSYIWSNSGISYGLSDRLSRLMLQWGPEVPDKGKFLQVC